MIIRNNIFLVTFSKVNVVSFNTEASTDGGSDVTSCFSERLALAVPENKRNLKKYIDGPKFIAQRKSNSYELFSLSCFTPASSLTCVEVVSVSFRLSGASTKDARGKKEKIEDGRSGEGGWVLGKETVSFLPCPSPSRSFFPRASFCACPARPKGNGYDFYAGYKLP